MMKNKTMIWAFAFIFLIAIMQSASSEMWMWSNTFIDTPKQTLTHHTYIQIDDTSNALVTIGQTVPIELIAGLGVDLPLNLTTSNLTGLGSIDYCNYTISVTNNIYDLSLFGNTNYKIINQTITNYNVYYPSGSNATNNVTQFYLRAKDLLTADFVCHYTNVADLNNSVVLSNQIATVSAYIPAFQCDGCSKYTFENLVNQNDQFAESINNATAFYDNFQNLVDKDFFVWLVVSWLIKIALILTAVGLIFVAMYFLYIFFKSIAEKIR